MKIQGMERWGEMTPAARLEFIGNVVVDIAGRIPDVAGGEADTLPVTRQEFDSIAEVIGGMVELHKAIEGEKSATAATVASLAAHVEAISREIAEAIEMMRGNREEVLSDIEALGEVVSNETSALKAAVGELQATTRQGQAVPASGVASDDKPDKKK